MSEDVNIRLHAPINRRRLIGGMAGAAVTTIAIGGLVSAQSTQTNASGTPAAGSAIDSESGTQENTVQAASDTIALVKKDRDSVASKIDMKTVDQILAVTTSLQAQASSATTSSTPSRDQLASAAETTAWAARDLIEAELSAFGLPSQQIGVSQELVDSHTAIAAASKTAASAKNKDASSLLTISQLLYTAAYDQYGKGVFMQAEKTSEAASGLVDAIDELLGASKSGNANGDSNGTDNHSDGEKNDSNNGTPDASGESGTNNSNQNDQGNDQQGDSSSDNGGNDGNDGNGQQDNGPEPRKPVDVPKPSF